MTVGQPVNECVLSDNYYYMLRLSQGKTIRTLLISFKLEVHFLICVRVDAKFFA
jgi:hypothetical protein